MWTKLIILFASFIIFFASAVTAQAGNWFIKNIDGGFWTSIAVDPNDNVHISYYYYSTADLRYATDASGSWITTAIDTTGSTGFYTSIALDNTNKAHILYVRNLGVASYGIQYATSLGDVRIPVSGNNIVWGQPSVAVDASNKVHITYFDYTNKLLKYAYSATPLTTPWTSETTGISFATISESACQASIVVGSDNKVHIVYYDAPNSAIKHIIRQTSGVWGAPVTVDSGSSFSYISVVIKNNNLYTTYSKGTDIKYAVYSSASSSWGAPETVESGNLSSPSIAVDSNNKAHISYRDAANTDIIYANNISGAWSREVVDSDSPAGGYNSVAVDSDNKVHISYFSNNFLRYATNAYVDIGLRIRDRATTTVRIACQGPGFITSPLRIRNDDGLTYGIALVGLSSSKASKARIRTSSGTKALRKFFP
ncbi:MAG: hypothetical protein FJZ10_03995 [Candidatus Omnitrophica bacterium]|nr:hypothetical protein [Candidatus Omnitrophota bacterium]